MKNILLLLLLLVITNVNAQSEADNLPSDSLELRQMAENPEDRYALNNFEVVFPTPESYKFMKYGEHEPFLATGTVNVSIPFYEIKVGNFSLPIAMQYATNGIKPTDTPHPLGYGWLLQPGLRITRILVGRDDFNYPRDIKSVDEVHAKTPRDRFWYLKSTLYHLGNERARDVQYGSVDSKVDIFTVHLPKEKINFVIEKENDKWVGVTDGSFAKIEVTEEEITVKDENGVTYIFGGGDNYVEKCFYEPIGMPVQYISAWGLRKIVLPNNSELLLTWEKIPSIIKQSWGNHTASLYDYHSKDMAFEHVPTYDFSMAEPLINYSEGLVRSHTKNNIILKSIAFPQGSIIFSYWDNRISTLDKIEVYAQNQQNTQPIKKAKFEYDTEGKLLNHIVLSDEGRYTFEYNAMPFYFYEAKKDVAGYYPTQDYWGYNNGAINLITLVPQITVSSPINKLVSVGKANREVDDTQIQANLLKKITYPLGGTTEFKYETHRFVGKTPEVLHEHNCGIPVDKYRQLTKGGGVRLAQMITKESESAPAIIKTYKYGECQENTDEQAEVNSVYSGNGVAPAEPTLDTFVNETWAVTMTTFLNLPVEFVYLYVTRRALYFGSGSYIGNYMMFSPNVWYKKVTEYVNNDIKTVYDYDYKNPVDNTFIQAAPSTAFINDPAFPRPVGRSFFSRRIPYRINTVSAPHLIKETKYEKQNTSFRKTEEKRLKYDCHVLKEYNNLEVVAGPLSHIAGESSCWTDPPYFVWSDDENESFFEPCFSPVATNYGDFLSYKGEYFDCYEYKLQLAKLIPVKEWITTYNINGAITNTSEYDYVTWGNNKMLKSKTISLSGSGSTLKEEYLYPWEDLSKLAPGQKAYTQQMINSNRITTPVQYERERDNSLIEKKIITYKDYGNGLILPQRENYTTQADTGQVYITYHEYDKYGNPLYVTNRDMLKTVYLWSYRGQHPIAEIKNADLERVKAQLGNIGSSIDVLSDKTELSEDYWIKLNLLRTTLLEAQVTIYRYKPLVGISSMVDPTGIVTYYEYDNCNRLTEIYRMINGEKQILKRFKYQVTRDS